MRAMDCEIEDTKKEIEAAKGGVPASENRNTSKEIALGLDVNLRPLRSEILVISPSTVLRLSIIAKIPNVVIK